MLKHIAIVMDGNGRWAKEKGESRSYGHKKGAEVVRDITTFCARSEIEYLTLYAFSTENRNRPKSEVLFLMKLLEEYLKKEERVYLENGIKFETIGDLDYFSKSLQKQIARLKEITRKGENLTQILALNYGSLDEIARAINSGRLKAFVEANDIRYALDSRDFPDVDLFLRTGGEKRLSNFLLLQSSYAELFFSDTLWPDFRAFELEHIIEEFYKRERRFGKIS